MADTERSRDNEASAGMPSRRVSMHGRRPDWMLDWWIEPHTLVSYSDLVMARRSDRDAVIDIPTRAAAPPPSRSTWRRSSRLPRLSALPSACLDSILNHNTTRPVSNSQQAHHEDGVLAPVRLHLAQPRLLPAPATTIATILAPEPPLDPWRAFDQYVHPAWATPTDEQPTR